MTQNLRIAMAQFDFPVGDVAGNAARIAEMIAFARDPTQWDAIRADPGLLTNAVKEMVRFASPVIHMRRTAMRDPFWSPWYGYGPRGYYGRPYRYRPGFRPIGAWNYGWYDPWFDGYGGYESYTVYISGISLKIDSRADGKRLFEGRDLDAWVFGDCFAGSQPLGQRCKLPVALQGIAGGDHPPELIEPQPADGNFSHQLVALMRRDQVQHFQLGFVTFKIQGCIVMAA